MKGYYGIIQYCPDPERMESVNVGALLFCPESRFLDAKISSTIQRVKRFFPESLTQHDRRRFEAAKQAIVNRIKRGKVEITSREDLEQFIASRANMLRISPLRSMNVRNPAAELDELFHHLVDAPTTPKEDETEDDEENRLRSVLYEQFRKPEFRGRIQFDYKIVVPKIEKEIVFPFVYRNGAVNLIGVKQFARTQQALQQAESWAIQGDLLRRHPSENNAGCRVILISAFADPENREIVAKVTGLLEEYRVRPILSSQIPGFVEEVHREATAS